MEIFIAQHGKTATNVLVHSTTKNRQLEAKFVLKLHFTLVISLYMDKSNTKSIRIQELSENLPKAYYINYNTHTVFKTVKKKALNM